MAFNSLSFLFVFLPITVFGYWLLVRASKQSLSSIWLLLASIAFYACASLRSLAIVLPSILFDYAIAKAAISLDHSNPRARTSLIVIGVVANVLFLGYFKYRNFFLENVDTLVGLNIRLESIVLPLGLSFLTFQKIGFLCDVYSERVTSTRLRDFMLFTLFFPRTVAGPIVRYKEVIPQLYRPSSESALSDVTVGFCLLSIGLFKKCVVGDGIGKFVTLAFDSNLSNPIVGPLDLTNAWLGVLAYTLQLYFDFSGYSDMALGVARMVGIRLPMNFNSPLKATSMVDYWGRWHITLTRFLTWHIYSPLVTRITRARAARRRPLLRGQKSTASAMVTLIAIPTGVTMLVSGIWHGAGWQFVIWGSLHGAYLTINQVWRLIRPRFWSDPNSYERVMRPIGWLLTFTCVVVALVFFRSSSISDALSILGSMSGLHGLTPHQFVLARQAGFDFDWVGMAEPLGPATWILAVLFWVLLAPNSLELLRRFHPALDFPLDVDKQVRSQTSEQIGKLRKTGRVTHLSTALFRMWFACRKVGIAGVSLNRRTAIAVSIMFVLGAMAIGNGSGFLYGGF